ncbi:MAG: Efflux transporter, RND family, MFP subunit [Candidatus Uhrbacteria bacterium GW2011_GWE2_45_35]|uniref:Efflux transporter, RND family, MFP subunit n=2 Tax=Candidatus Uhriibacteriota TaxID=1752732 RepID=A0A0G1MHN1_9BACT|nr:MAG: Efflux transporter, RND family, MFP subunit [Candidatus Uhrbacteria bacterium GW2011_GWF2_44_350]KKU08023.1 MAG: Efflux transporter, RND family, MFP subunit [Candidatus Uhrbacteria bacterium GW2011_GWE2_45_35]
MVAVAIGAFFLFRKPVQQEIVTAQVEVGTLVQTVDANGVLESLDKVDLAFGTSGTAGVILVEVGDDVHAGDLLATLDLAKLEADRASVWQTVEIARANLSQKLAGSTSEAVAVAEAALASAQASLTSTEATTAAAVTEAEVILNSTEEDLENVKLDNAEDLVGAYADLFQELRDAAITVRSALSEADEVLGIDNTMANDDFQDVLGANDWQSLNSAKNAYNIAKKSRDAAEDAVYALSPSSTNSTVEAAEGLVKTALNDTALVLLYVRRTLDGTNIDTADFSSADLATLEAAIDTTRNGVQTVEEALLAVRQTIDQLEITNASELTTAENLVKKYQAALASAEASATYSVAVKQSALAEAEAGLNQVMALPRPVDLAALEAAVSQAEANYGEVQTRFVNAQIFTPIAGKVTKIDFERGEQVVANTPVLTVQTTTSQFQIAANISETDISKIALNNPVEITFDAFGGDQKFTGLVGKIDPAEKVIEGVVYYKVTVYLEDSVESINWKTGMTANLSILTVQKDDVLRVPQRAVLEHSGGGKYVRLPDGNDFVEQDVKVGSRGDDGWTEVFSGLTEGQTVITSIR